jgi:hypothetical protein
MLRASLRRVSDAFAIALLVLAVVGIVGILWAISGNAADRSGEDRAREFFDAHGRWPDESPDDVARRRALAELPAPPTAEPDELGRV